MLAASARSPARRIIGPSASGSENGKPISMMLALVSIVACASATRVAEVCVFWTDARVVETGRDRVCVEDLTVLVGEQRRARAVQHTGAARSERGGAGSLHADQRDILVGDELREHPDRVRAP